MMASTSSPKTTSRRFAARSQGGYLARLGVVDFASATHDERANPNCRARLNARRSSACLFLFETLKGSLDLCRIVVIGHASPI